MTTETKREITYLEALREAMVQEMRVDDEVFLIGEDVGTYGGAFGVSKGMLEEFGPERVRDTPFPRPQLQRRDRRGINGYATDHGNHVHGFPHHFDEPAGECSRQDALHVWR